MVLTASIRLLGRLLSGRGAEGSLPYDKLTNMGHEYLHGAQYEADCDGNE